MKVVAYSIQPYEKEFLAIANHKKHDITLITNPLNFDTLTYAAGKDGVIVSATDLVSADMIKILASLHIKYIISRAADMDHIDKEAVARYGIRLANAGLGTINRAYLTPKALRKTANQTIKQLDIFQLTKDRRMAANKISFH